MTNWPQHRPLWFGGGVAGPVITLDGATISEAAAIGDAVGDLAVVGGSGSYTFTVTGGTGDDLFTVDGDVLEVAAALDFLTLPFPTVTIEADNGVDDPITRTFTITVTDFIPPESPTDNDGGPEDIPGLIGIYLPDPAYLFQDTVGATPVTADNQDVRRIVPAYGTGPALVQAGAFLQPKYRTAAGVRWLNFLGDGEWLEAVQALADPDLYFAALFRSTDTRNGQVISSCAAAGETPWGSANGATFMQRSSTDAVLWRTSHNFNSPANWNLDNDTDYLVESIWSAAGVTIHVDGVQVGSSSFVFDPNATRWLIAAGATAAGGATESHEGRIYAWALVSGQAVSADHRALIRDTLTAGAGL
jgi:hypothetical protein